MSGRRCKTFRKKAIDLKLFEKWIALSNGIIQSDFFGGYGEMSAASMSILIAGSHNAIQGIKQLI